MRIILTILATMLAASAAHAQMGSQTFSKVTIDRLEYRHSDDADIVLWDVNAWYGGDEHKFRAKAEGELDLDDDVQEAEFQALYSRAVTAFFDVNFGLRQDIEPSPNRTHAVIGLEGLAPYWFEVDAAAFISHKGDVTARIEAEYELLFTQKLILQPRVELNFAAQGIPELGIGAGISDFQAGLRLRYEIVREFAPYIGIAWEQKLGDTKVFAQAVGDDASSIGLVAGIRAWF